MVRRKITIISSVTVAVLFFSNYLIKGDHYRIPLNLTPPPLPVKTEAFGLNQALKMGKLLGMGQA